jgi:hypothetical protein
VTVFSFARFLGVFRERKSKSMVVTGCALQSRSRVANQHGFEGGLIKPTPNLPKQRACIHEGSMNGRSLRDQRSGLSFRHHRVASALRRKMTTHSRSRRSSLLAMLSWSYAWSRGSEEARHAENNGGR